MISSCPKCKEEYSSSNEYYKHICPDVCCPELKGRLNYDIKFYDWEPNWYVVYDGSTTLFKIFYCPFCGKELNRE